MRSRVWARTFPFGRFAAIKLTVRLYRTPGVISGYYSRVGGTGGHIVTVDIDAAPGSADAPVIDAALGVAYDQCWPDVWVLRTDKGFHIVTTLIATHSDIVHAYDALAQRLPTGYTLDWRHLGFGLMRDLYTLRIGRKNNPASRQVSVIAYDCDAQAAARWSQTHWYLLNALTPGERTTPDAAFAVDAPLPLVVYKE